MKFQFTKFRIFDVYCIKCVYLEYLKELHWIKKIKQLKKDFFNIYFFFAVNVFLNILAPSFRFL